MASSIISEDFEYWLSAKLNSLNTDEGVFGSYIVGILSGDEPLEEKTEALEGILAEISGSDITKLTAEILDKWRECRADGEKASQDSPASQEKQRPEEVEEKLVKLLEKNRLAQPVLREYTEEERKIREAILSQYAETSDQELDDSEGEEETKTTKENGLVKNTNVSSVIQAEKEKREKAKSDSQKKKEKDKEDRERQKQQAADKKEKRKTQKGERRR